MAGYSGKGVTVTILDDGVEWNHPDLSRFNIIVIIITSFIITIIFNIIVIISIKWNHPDLSRLTIIVSLSFYLYVDRKY